MSNMQTKTAGFRHDDGHLSSAGAVGLVLEEEDHRIGGTGLDLVPSALVLRPERRRSDPGQDRSDERGTGGTGAAAQGESRAADGARHPKKSHGLFRQEPSVTFAWINAEKAAFPIRRLCRTMRVSPSGFYAARGRAESTHARDDRRLRLLVRTAFDESRRRYGSPRVHRDLIEQEIHVSRKRVARLMQEDGLIARARKRFKMTTMSDHDQPVADNLLNRQFEAEAPNRRWVGDTTEFVIGDSGKLYLASILDLYSRFVVGWAVSAVNDRHLTMRALDMALKRRCPDLGLMHHSDQGSTYASEDYRAVLETHRITCSMSRRGNCHDNAVVESFFSTVKAELGEWFGSHGEAKMELFDYIEVFYNQRRRHSTIGQISPAVYERRSQTG